jgi:hypothetical protein
MTPKSIPFQSRVMLVAIGEIASYSHVTEAKFQPFHVIQQRLVAFCRCAGLARLAMTTHVMVRSTTTKQSAVATLFKEIIHVSLR